MLKLTIVRVSGGFIGSTYSDRWNIQTLREMGLDLSKCLTDGQFGHWRRQAKRLGFQVCLRSKEAPRWGLTLVEEVNMRGYEVLSDAIEALRVGLAA
jgi:hypothetical protein